MQEVINGKDKNIKKALLIVYTKKNCTKLKTKNVAPPAILHNYFARNEEYLKGYIIFLMNLKRLKFINLFGIFQFQFSFS